MTDIAHILVVDDHRDIREPLAKYLIKNGYRVSQADSAASARQVLAANAIDLVVLDIMMPGEDGLSLCRHIQATGDVAVILLTALADETDRIVGLEIGADDYVTKPFSPRELLARIKAVLRRITSLPPKTAKSEKTHFKFANWQFDVHRRDILSPDGVSIALSTAEFDLLYAFLTHPDVVLSREQLLDLARGRDAIPFDRSIDNQISRLRKKLEVDPKNPEIIKTVWGGGYILSQKVISQ